MERRRYSRVSGVNLERQYTAEQLEFLKAIDRFKREHNPHPTWPQVLAIAKALGYRKMKRASELDVLAKNEGER